MVSLPEELTANQIQFVNLVIDYLTQSGWMSAAQLYESPFTDFSPKGVEGVFDSGQVAQLVFVLRRVWGADSDHLIQRVFRCFFGL